jgi:hypothetical protein
MCMGIVRDRLVVAKGRPQIVGQGVDQGRAEVPSSDPRVAFQPAGVLPQLHRPGFLTLTVPMKSGSRNGGTRRAGFRQCSNHRIAGHTRRNSAIVQRDP